MFDYYDSKLAAERLRRCYQVAPPRTVQYLEAEAVQVIGMLRSGQKVIELGCGYGRFIKRILRDDIQYYGIDYSEASISLAKGSLLRRGNVKLAVMTAESLAFRDSEFDITLCVQNGISSFHIDQSLLFREAVRVTKPKGIVLFSTYASAFWPNRLEWFEAQAKANLIGPIDHDATKNGVIVCKDGFHATTVDPAQFRQLASNAGQEARTYEVDGSSLFCEVEVKK